MREGGRERRGERSMCVQGGVCVCACMQVCVNVIPILTAASLQASPQCTCIFTWSLLQP